MEAARQLVSLILLFALQSAPALISAHSAPAPAPITQPPAPNTPIAIAVSARAMQPGELVVVTVGAPAGTTRVTVRAFDRTAAAYAAEKQEWRALVGIDLDVKPGAYSVSVEADGVAATREIVVAAKTFPTRRLTVNPDFVTPPPSAAERIAREARLIETTWRSSADARLWTGPFIRPVSEAANSAFGTRSVFNGQPRGAHGGADFLSPAGTPVHAPNAGRVVIARDLYYSGNTVIIDHGLGLFSMLAHFSEIDVHEGDRVETGQTVGRVGATGRVTGAHLHWAVRAGGARVDPLSLVAMLGKM